MDCLLKELLVLVGEYASRCPVCFGCLLTNGYCTNVSNKSLRQLDSISTFQIIPGAEDNTIPLKWDGPMTSAYDRDHAIIEKFQACKNQTFLVVHVEVSGYFGGDYVKLIFGRCIDHWCYRKVKDYLGVFYCAQTKKWRWLTLAEIRCDIDERIVKNIHRTYQKKIATQTLFF